MVEDKPKRNMNNPFQISPDTKLGRGWIASAMKVHNELICHPKACTDSKQSKFSKQYAHWLKSEERWKPSWDQRMSRKASDKILKDQLRKIKNTKGGAGTTDCYPSKKAEQFRKWRARNPTYLPGFSKAMWIKAQLDRHEEVIKGATACVDNKLDDMHGMFKDWRAKNPPLPPISEPTPEQYFTAKYGKQSPEAARRQLAMTLPGGTFGPQANKERDFEEEDPIPWPAPAESGVMSMSETIPRVKPVMDEHLVRHIFEISMNSTSNENVARILQERTHAKFPTVFSKTMR